MADQMTGLLSPFLRSQRIAAAAPYLGMGRVLDYGCGVGELAGIIDQNRYLGLDVDLESIEQAARAHPNHRFVLKQDFESVPGGAGFDVVVALALIEHIDRPAEWLVHMSSLLADGGRIVLTTPHPAARRIHEFGARLGIFSREASEEHQDLLGCDDLQRIAAVSGLRMIEYRRFLLGYNQIAVMAPVTSDSEPSGSRGANAGRA